jgi:hypothetical protein
MGQAGLLGIEFVAYAVKPLQFLTINPWMQILEGNNEPVVQTREAHYEHATLKMGGPAMESPPFFFEVAELSLDDKEQQSIRETSMRLAKDDVRRNAEITVARMELVELARKTPMDINAIVGRLRQISALDLNVQLSHFKAMAEIESKLTPEQKRRLNPLGRAGAPIRGANARHRRILRIIHRSNCDRLQTSPAPRFKI